MWSREGCLLKWGAWFWSYFKWFIQVVNQVVFQVVSYFVKQPDKQLDKRPKG